MSGECCAHPLSGRQYLPVTERYVISAYLYPDSTLRRQDRLLLRAIREGTDSIRYFISPKVNKCSLNFESERDETDYRAHIAKDFYSDSLPQVGQPPLTSLSSFRPDVVPSSDSPASR